MDSLILVEPGPVAVEAVLAAAVVAVEQMLVIVSGVPVDAFTNGK